ncbi:RNA chaperone Hfq [Vibrio natriegens]
MKKFLCVVTLASGILLSSNSALAKDDLFQNLAYDCLIANQIPVSIYLVNGIKLQGIMGNYNDNVILLKNTTDQYVQLHAVSTIVPARPGCEQ